jgi:hypothetical protein
MTYEGEQMTFIEPPVDETPPVEPPVEPPAEPEPTEPPATIHVVQPGDTLDSIAAEHGMDSSELLSIAGGHIDRLAAARGHADSAGGHLLIVGDALPLTASIGPSGTVAGTGSPSAELARMNSLHASGAISDSEYEAVKARLLARV